MRSLAFFILVVSAPFVCIEAQVDGVRTGVNLRYRAATSIAAGDSALPLRVRANSRILVDTSRSSHATRDGALIGAGIGLAAGIYAGSFYSTSCLLSVGCSATKRRIVLMLATGVEAGAVFAAIGAVSGKVWSSIR